LNLVFESWRQVVVFGPSGVDCGSGLATEYFVGIRLGQLRAALYCSFVSHLFANGSQLRFLSEFRHELLRQCLHLSEKLIIQPQAGYHALIPKLLKCVKAVF
jgi:hypothetical protein